MANRAQNFIVELQPIGRRAEISPGETLLSAAQSVGVELQAVCGGAGTCGQCKVRLMAGSLSAPTAQEKEKLGQELLEGGCRLACQALAASHVTLEIPPESLTSLQRVQLDGLDLGVSLDPRVVPFDLAVDASLPGKLRKTINEAVGQDMKPGAESFEQLSETAQRFAGHVRAVISKESSPPTIVGILPEKTRIFGLAVDLGTTKLASYLVDLETGKTVAQRGLMNPQIAYGEDVVSRISRASHSGEATRQLQRRVIEALNQTVREFCNDLAVSPEQIVEAVVVGNTAMHHFFAGLPVQQLGTAPYLPATTDPLHLAAQDLGMAIAPGASIYTPPNIAGYVGGDHVAMLIGTGAGARKSGPPFLAIDIGTNTEATLSVGRSTEKMRKSTARTSLQIMSIRSFKAPFGLTNCFLTDGVRLVRSTCQTTSSDSNPEPTTGWRRKPSSIPQCAWSNAAVSSRQRGPMSRLRKNSGP